MKKSTKTIVIIFVSIIVMLFGIAGFIKTNQWFNTHYFEFTAPVEVKLNQPIAIKERKPIIQKVVLEYPGGIDTPIEKYICEKFGVYECKTALAVASVEGLNHPADG
ncbi:MAG: hypothetical protein AABY22_30650, partial [Nanoarchaeota archaeon]